MQKIQMVLIITMLISVGCLSGCVEEKTETQNSNDNMPDSNLPENNNTILPLDSDNDGYPDNIDVFPNNPYEWRDIDNDGYGDNSDDFPSDPLFHKKMVLCNLDYLEVKRYNGPYCIESLIAVPVTSDIKYVAWEIKEVSSPTGDIMFRFTVSRVSPTDNVIYSGDSVSYTNTKIYVTQDNIGAWSWNWFQCNSNDFALSIYVYYVL
jgi:hypothetical protein